MKKKKRFPIWKILKLPPQILYAIGAGPIYGRIVLLLTTTGRISGKPRVTPLQYEEIDGDFYLGSARGEKADWYCNIINNPKVNIRVKSRHFEGIAEPISNMKLVADFLEFRLNRHPKMIGAIMRFEGLPKNPSREDIENYANNRTIVIVRPLLEKQINKEFKNKKTPSP